MRHAKFLSVLFPLLITAGVAFLARRGTLAEKETRPVFTGVEGCRDCHTTGTIGNQYQKWVASRHSQAYTTLLTEKAETIAKIKGIDSPHTHPQCLRCHVTGESEWKDKGFAFAQTFSVKEGVGCEACHGPGSVYCDVDTMNDRRRALAAGLLIPDKETCIKCHNEDCPTYSTTFDYDAALKEIAHPVPEDLPGDEPIKWIPSIAQGLEIAGNSAQPMLILFWFPKGCPICEGLIPVFADPAVIQAVKKDVVPVRILKPDKARLSSMGLLDAGIRFTTPSGATIKDLYGNYPPELLLHVINRVKMVTGAVSSPDPWQIEGLPKDVRGKITQVHANLLGLQDLYLSTAARVLAELDETVMKRLLACWLWGPDFSLRKVALILSTRLLKDTDERFHDIFAFLFDSSPDMRKTALDMLGELKEGRASRAIARWLLCDEVKDVGLAAFVALGKIRDAAVVPRLIEFFHTYRCCHDPNCPLRYEALATLYAIGDPNAAAAVQEIARDSPHHRPLAIAALGELKNTSAAGYLLQVAADGAEMFAARNEAIFALAKILLANPKELGLRSTVLCGLLPVMAKTIDPELRASVCEIFGRLNARETTHYLRQTIENDESPIPRAYAIFALGAFLSADSKKPQDSADDSGEILRIIEAYLNSPVNLERNMAIDAMVRMGKREYLPLARYALRDRTSEQVEDRKALTIAAKTCLYASDRLAVPHLIAVLDLTDLDTSRYAVMILERLTGRSNVAPGTLPIDLPRLILAGAPAPSIEQEQSRILDMGADMVIGWRKWWRRSGVAFMEGVMETVAPAPDAPRRIEAEIVQTGGEDESEYHVWVKVALLNEKGEKTRPIGILRIHEASDESLSRIFRELPPRGGDPGHEALSLAGLCPNCEPPPSNVPAVTDHPVLVARRAFSAILSPSHWKEAAVGPDGMKLDETELPRTCAYGGDLFIRVLSGLRVEKEQHPGFEVEFIGEDCALTVRIPAFEY